MQKEDISKLKSFLNQSKNSRVRESIFKYGLLFDLKLASSSIGRNLKIYEQEVDNEGCDIIIEDGTGFSRKIQLKSIFETTTTSWKIHKSILRPAFSQMEDYGFDATPCPVFPGGVILIEAFDRNADDAQFPISLKYSYTDINIISLVSLGVISDKKDSKSKAESILHTIRNTSGGLIEVNKSLFLPLKDSISLIKIMGFNQQYNFMDNARKFTRNKIAPSKFFQKEIRNYNCYESNRLVLSKWNEEKEKQTEWHLKALKEIIDEVCRR